jgi:dimethylargininase
MLAITREVSHRLFDCELSFQDREPIDVARAMEQHAAYRAALTHLGAAVTCLPALDDQPDCVFVEDPMIVLDEVAIVTRMGAASRRAESESLARAIAPHRELRHIEAPATLEGGDVMQIGKTLYVGLSRRTNIAGIQQLARLVEPFGYWVTPVEVRGCLHLKSACTFLGQDPSGNDTLLINRAWLDVDAFCSLKFLDVHEPHAANTLRINETILMPASYPETQALLERQNFRVLAVDISELIKAEAGVTCMSLLVR